jgi:hypothetical protein
MLYDTFINLKEVISAFHLAVVSARATMTEDFCSLSVEELQRLRVKVERLLEQFD